MNAVTIFRVLIKLPPEQPLNIFQWIFPNLFVKAFPAASSPTTCPSFTEHHLIVTDKQNVIFFRNNNNNKMSHI